MEQLEKVTHTYDVNLVWDPENSQVQLRAGNRMPILVSAPPEFGGSNEVWSPEHLILASLSSCYVTTFMYFANLLKVSVRHLKVSSKVNIEKEGKGMFEANYFILYPSIEFQNDPSQRIVESLLDKAKRYCIVSNSVKGQIVVEPVISYS
ncbi:MAG: OsmC family protein [Bacteroidia bacterium]|nr:OsmC family protein [Bacteroidia bacterium]